MNGGAGGWSYVRAIDGLRGVAVIAVLAFHGGVPGASGGFLGVSLFFTLSGYLITQLLLREHETSGRISLRSFWGRRVRRLAPAALVTLLAIGLLIGLTDLFPGASVPGDLAAAATNVANWRFAVAQTSYQDLFTAGPSPVLHFWSLAIEEQFYVLFPLLVAMVLARLGRSRLPLVLGALTAVGVIASAVSSADFAYYSTLSRAPELLVGALLALVLPIERSLAPAVARTIAVAGTLGALGLLSLVATTTVDDDWLHAGGLPAISLLSAAIIAATLVTGPVRRATSWAPVVAIGRISYGIYVYHWPLFLLLSAERIGFGGPPLFALRILATGIAASASARLLENPVRRGHLLPRVRVGSTVFAGTLAAVLVLALIATPTAAPVIVPEDASLTSLASFNRAPERPLVDVLVVGSVPALTDWVRDAAPPELDVRVRSTAQAGCPLLLPDRTEGGCRSFDDRARPARARTRPDLVVVGLGESDRAPMRDALRRTAPGSADVIGATYEALAISREVLDTQMAALPGVPVMFVDAMPGDPLNDELRQLDLRSEAVTVSEAPDPTTFARDLRVVLATLHDDARLRVLVIGDSTAYQLAAALGAAGTGSISVAWAGHTGCPIVPVTRLRWAPGYEIDSSGCPSTTSGWPDAVRRFRPDVILAAASLAELSEHRYGASRTWVGPGTNAFRGAHDAGMEAIQQMARGSGALTVVATTPRLARGKLYDGPVGSPARLRAWQAQVTRWDDQWASVGVVDWAAIAVAAETGAGHDLREDAVHFEREPLLNVLGPRLVDELVRTATQLDAEARAAGCLVGPGPQRHLALDRCRLGP
ncbi:MAG: acyltransferase family protein [Microthrixaceae bacterium]